MVFPLIFFAPKWVNLYLAVGFHQYASPKVSGKIFPTFPTFRHFYVTTSVMLVIVYLDSFGADTLKLQSPYLQATVRNATLLHDNMISNDENFMRSTMIISKIGSTANRKLVWI